MSATYTCIKLHLIFAVKHRQDYIVPTIRPRLYSYIKTVLSTFQHDLIRIGGIGDHVHIFIRYNVNQLIPDLVKELKVASTKFVNSNHLIIFKFAWQAGYACFSVAPTKESENALIAYIDNQPQHHLGLSLQEEAACFLDRLGIEYDEQYLLMTKARPCGAPIGWWMPCPGVAPRANHGRAPRGAKFGPSDPLDGPPRRRGGSYLKPPGRHPQRVGDPISWVTPRGASAQRGVVRATGLSEHRRCDIVVKNWPIILRVITISPLLGSDGREVVSPSPTFRKLHVGLPTTIASPRLRRRGVSRPVAACRRASEMRHRGKEIPLL